MINTTFTNSSFFFGDYLNPQMTGFKYETKSDGVEFPTGIKLMLFGNPEEGFGVVYNSAVEGSESNTEVSVSELGAIIASDKRVVITSRPAPLTADADGQIGEVAFDENYIYRCVAVNTWKRSDLNTWLPETE